MVFINCEYDKELKKYCITEKGNLTENFIVIEPEILLAPTSIKNAFPCLRRSIFSENFKTINLNTSFSKDMVIGSIVHEIFEHALLSGNLECINDNNAYTLIKKVTKNFNLEILLSGLEENELLKICKDFILNIIKFFNEHFINKKTIDGISLTSVVGAEKSFQSQVFGMKGIIDMLVEVTDEKNERITIPLELKTGNNMSNRDYMQVNFIIPY